MLFLGTETYPKPGEYQEFINRHGGSHNAWTGTEFTNFFFDLHHEFFAEGLHRFSQFFTCPTFEASLIDKSATAVDSEFKLKLKMMCGAAIRFTRRQSIRKYFCRFSW